MGNSSPVGRIPVGVPMAVPDVFGRVDWTGKLPFEIHEMRVRPDGFEFTFTARVDGKTAGDPASCVRCVNLLTTINPTMLAPKLDAGLVKHT